MRGIPWGEPPRSPVLVSLLEDFLSITVLWSTENLGFSFTLKDMLTFTKKIIHAHFLQVKKSAFIFC